MVPPLYYPFLSTHSLPTSPLTFSKLPPFYFHVLVFLKTSAMIRKENVVFVFLSLAWFNPVISSFISFFSNNTVLFFEMNNTPQRVYLSYSTVLYLPAGGHSGWFHTWAMVNRAASSMAVNYFLTRCVSWCVHLDSSRCVVVFYGSCVFRSLRNHHSDFHSAWECEMFTQLTSLFLANQPSPSVPPPGFHFSVFLPPSLSLPPSPPSLSPLFIFHRHKMSFQILMMSNWRSEVTRRWHRVWNATKNFPWALNHFSSGTVVQ